MTVEWRDVARFSIQGLIFSQGHFPFFRSNPPKAAEQPTEGVPPPPGPSKPAPYVLVFPIWFVSYHRSFGLIGEVKYPYDSVRLYVDSWLVGRFVGLSIIISKRAGSLSLMILSGALRYFKCINNYVNIDIL